MRHIKLFLWVLPSLLLSNTLGISYQKSTILFCYGKLNVELIKGYNFVILESKHYNASEISKIKKHNKKVLAYISLGEVNSNASHYKLLKNNLLGKNENWDSHYLDLKSKKTVSTLLSIIDKTLTFGYDGLFLDNIDNFTTFGYQKNQKKELVDFLKKLDSKYPNSFFMQNAGVQIIKETAPYVDGITVESVATNYTFADNKYKLRDKVAFQKYIEELKYIEKKYNLPIILVEYADTQSLFKAVQKRVLKTNFEYFIGKLDLQSIPKFSK